MDDQNASEEVKLLHSTHPDAGPAFGVKKSTAVSPTGLLNNLQASR